jgi:NADH:ubiquinone oxidoreductase subunit E
LAGKRIFGTGYRAFRSKVIVDNDIPLNKDVCKDCYLCVEYCPTSALTRARKPEDKSRGKKMASCTPHLRPQRVEDGDLLPMLKAEQDKSRHVPYRFMAKTADSLGLSASDVYGVSTFYSFLSTRPMGKNVIRVCKSVPCYLRGSDMILKSIEDAIGIKPGQITPDKKFSLELANCIGACDKAPAMLVNHEVCGDLTPGKISRILKQY